MLSFVLPFLAMFVVFGFVWPIGSALDLGQWVESESDDGGWTFFFDEEYRWVGWAVTIFFIFQLFALYKVVQRMFRKPLAANPKYRDFPEAKNAPESWEEQKNQNTPVLMFEYDSAVESDLRRQQRPFWAGGCLMNLAPFLGALTAGVFGFTLDPGPSGPRVFILLGFYSLGVALLIYGAKVKATQPVVDDRLLFDFEAQEVQKIALHDPFCKPERWFGFEDIKHLIYTKGVRSNGAPRDGTLELVAGEGHFELFHRHSGDWGALARRLAEWFSTPLEIEEVTRSES